MSTNHPGPYGAQPGPYGHQPPPQAPYVQQPVPPQGPYGQQQFGGGGGVGHGYGWPPQQGFPSGPPRKSGKGWWVVAGVLTGLIALGGGVVWLLLPKGPEDDGPHRLTAPSTMSFSTYYRAGDPKDPHLATTDAKKLDWYEMEKPTEIAVSYSDELLDGADTSSDASDALRRAQNSKRFSVVGAYGRFNNPELALSYYFGMVRDNLRETADKAPGHVISSLSVEEDTETDSLDGAALRCANLKVDSWDDDEPATETVVCGWADYATVGVVTPYNGMLRMSKEESADLTGKIRNEMRVPTN
ncbi:hypothetical protein ABZY90_14235 [Streptomyces sp. NPDC006422]|uniref:hypothetical protein n=1 Tax=unclassified Streptomyces TaxID=2593676 RepID=UPI0033B9CB5A